MKNRILLFLFLSGFLSILYGQNNNIPDSLILLFHKQLFAFPQEKIYMQIDKPYYISGERIWFRAYLADAKSHEPVSVSRYVYVELINPLDSVVTRVKIRQENEAYYGYLSIPADVSEGNYTIRAYTTFMRSQDENYFYTKSIYIGDPQAQEVRTEAQFTFDSDSRVHATFRFFHGNTSEPLQPQSIKMSINNGKLMNIKSDDKGIAGVNFNFPVASRKRIILLEAMISKNLYRQFIQVPVPDNDFDVSFYPEGGSLLQGTLCKVAFKAMKSNGQSMDISGAVYDESGIEKKDFSTEHFGMGSFSFIPERGKSYYAVCRNGKGQSKRFDLPAAAERGYSLSVNRLKDKIFVTALKPAEAKENDELYLLAHTRGYVNFAYHLDQEKNLSFNQNQFPSGVLHLILFDAGLNPISERLVFISNQDQAQVTYHQDKENYAPRSLVKNQIMVIDSAGQPLAGNFSIAVTSDKEVTSDSTSNILTQLLLASDLRGNIENPVYYFQNTAASALALDLLMCTQGWRRYNIAELVHGRFSKPSFPIETGSEISGIVKTGLFGKPAKNVEVSAMSFNTDCFEKMRTDKNGRFYLRGVEWPDSVRFILETKSKGVTNTELILDMDTFPKRTLSALPLTKVDKNQFVKYVDKAEQKYVSENGNRMIYLPEVTITAQRKPLVKSIYYDSPSNFITGEEIQKSGVTDVITLLRLIPGVQVHNSGGITIRNSLHGPLLLIDDIPQDKFDKIYEIDIYSIEQIDILKESNIFGMRGGSGVVLVYTKRGKNIIDNTKSLNIKTISPLGYQQLVEFYAPKYDTPEKRETQVSDLRTTIYWQPVVPIDNQGIASFEFYTADDSTSYTVVAEGLAIDGSIIRQVGKINVLTLNK